MLKFPYVFKELMVKNAVGRVLELLKKGTLGVVISEIILLGTSRKALELVCLSEQMKVQRKLKKKYVALVERIVPNIKNNHPKNVWVCWLQGIEQAPEIVKKCFDSLKKHFIGWNVVLITEKNYQRYTNLPQYIISKFNRGNIIAAHFSDLLRLDLLSQHGGLWLDATVYCTGVLPDEIVNTDFFVYQGLKPGQSGHTVRLSNWLIWSVPHAYFVEQTKRLLYKYWEKEDRAYDYFLFHHFMTMVMNEHEDEVLKILPASNTTPHILLLRLFEKYDEKIWKWLSKQTPFHKLSYKFSDSKVKDISGTYYEKIIGIN